MEFFFTIDRVRIFANKMYIFSDMVETLNLILVHFSMEQHVIGIYLEGKTSRANCNAC